MASNIVSKINAAMEVFRAGKEVANPEVWKAGGQITNTLVALLSGIVILLNQFDCSFCQIALSNEQIISISAGIVALVSVFQNIVHAVSSKRSSMSISHNIGVIAGTVPTQEKQEQEAQEVSQKIKAIIEEGQK